MRPQNIKVMFVMPDGDIVELDNLSKREVQHHQKKWIERQQQQKLEIGLIEEQDTNETP